jgi:hypothetical protein
MLWVVASVVRSASGRHGFVAVAVAVAPPPPPLRLPTGGGSKEQHRMAQEWQGKDAEV